MDKYQKTLKNNFVFEVLEGHEWFWKQYTDGTWEIETFKIFDKYISKDRCYFDIGAWIGPTVLYGSKLAKEVYAFEPDPVANLILEKNIKVNDIGNVVISQSAVSAKNGYTEIGIRGDFADSMSSEIWSKNKIKAHTVSLQEVGEEHNPNFIKIDIEGGEFIMLPPAKEYLEKYKPTIYLSLHTPYFVGEAKQKYLDAVCDVLSIYPKLLDEWMNPVPLEDVRNFIGFRSVIGTFE